MAVNSMQDVVGPLSPQHLRLLPPDAWLVSLAINNHRESCPNEVFAMASDRLPAEHDDDQKMLKDQDV